MTALHTATEQNILSAITGAAPLLHAFIECSTELQRHAKDMLEVLLDPETDEEDRFLATSTLADILFPNTHEGDKMLGLDLVAAEELAKGSPTAAAVLADMDCQEATFADRLRDLMADRGLTQAELAAKVGVGQPAIANMLGRTCRPQRKTVAKLATALGVEPTALWPELKS